MRRFLIVLALFLSCYCLLGQEPAETTAPHPITDERGPPDAQPVATPPVALRSVSLRPFRLSCYFIAHENDYPRHPQVEMRAKDGTAIAMVSAAAFAHMALEGSGRLKDGRLVNVTGDWLPALHEDYAEVLEYAHGHGWRCCPGYAGLILDGAGKIVHVRSWMVVRQLPHIPFKTVAADIGAFSTSDKRYRGQGGLVPLGTRIWLWELDGMRMPNGMLHDGWVTVTDTGANVFGAHLDLFCGEYHRWHPPERSDTWFEGIEDRMPEDYSYGL